MTIQAKIEELILKSVNTVIKKPSSIGLPKKADSFISSITVISSSGNNIGNSVEVDLSWLGRNGLSILPGVSLKNNPLIIVPKRAVGGGLLLISKDLHYKGAPIEITIIGDVYKIKGMDTSYVIE